ncbi:MAG: amino acid permease, partial [Alphaproteobacteria bacterium]
PLAGFLYGWTLFTVIQTGTVAAVTVGFARHVGLFLPWIAENRWIVPPVHLSAHYALSLSTAQALAIAVVALITWMHTRGVTLGRLVQDVFTTAKIGILLALLGLGLLLGRHGAGIAENFGRAWEQRGLVPVSLGMDASTTGGLLAALAIAQVGSLFSSDAWNNITFAAAEVRRPKRDIPLALAIGTGTVVGLYFLANLVYFAVLPLDAVQHAASDRVGAAAMEAMLPGLGAKLLAAGILVSTFGCANGMLLAGAGAYWGRERDGVFFPGATEL